MKPENEGHTLELGVWLLGVGGGGGQTEDEEEMINQISPVRP